MKTIIIIVAFLASCSSFAGLVPRINCVGSVYDKAFLDKNEVQEDKVLLQFTSGGAAFSDTFLGYLNEYTFIVVINKSLPISNFEIAPLQLGIYKSEGGITLATKSVNLLPNGITAKTEAVENKKILTLSCSRLLNP